MTLWQGAFQIADRAPLPDMLVRPVIDTMVRRTGRALDASDAGATARFAAEMASMPIAVHTAAANAQHYEVPAAFYEHMLGPRRKYSCAYFETSETSLADAEDHALAMTTQRAGLVDGQAILELGCGWGSLSLWMAGALPRARIVAVTNSTSQRAYIVEQAVVRGLANLSVIRADMNRFAPGQKFDRIVSVEMFEHMANWRKLLQRTRDWLADDGRLFVHVFSHRTTPYRFDHTNDADWIAQHFFTGGFMPSHELMRAFPDLFDVEQAWIWNGKNYAQTAECWLANFDANRVHIEPILQQIYGREAGCWRRRWRYFLLATAGLFGANDGRDWAVSHYLLKPNRA